MRRKKKTELTAEEAPDFISEVLSKFSDLDEDMFVSDEVQEKDVSVISTGSVSLDVSLGVGGIPRGKYTEIFGPEGSGKTTLCLNVVKTAIQNGLNALYLDAENDLDISYMKSVVGDFDTSRLVLSRPETSEQVLNIAEAGIDSGQFGLIVLDSVGGLAPEAEKEKELGESTVALTAKLLTQFLRRNTYKLRKNNIAFIFINQVRDDIGAKYIKSFSTPGGHALKHFCSIRISTFSAGKIEEGDSIIGILSRFIVAKNKIAAPFKTSVFPIIFGSGIDTQRDAILFAQSISVVKTKGAYFYLRSVDGEDLNMGAGMKNAVQFLRENPEVLDKLVKMCYNVIQPQEEREAEVDG